MTDINILQDIADFINNEDKSIYKAVKSFVIDDNQILRVQKRSSSRGCDIITFNNIPCEIFVEEAIVNVNMIELYSTGADIAFLY